MKRDDLFWKEFRIEIQEELKNIETLERELKEGIYRYQRRF